MTIQPNGISEPGPFDRKSNECQHIWPGGKPIGSRRNLVLSKRSLTRSAVSVMMLMGFSCCSQSWATSFDCKKSQQVALEKIICANEIALGDLDDQLNVAYQWALARTASDESRSKLVVEQRNWLRKLGRMCKDNLCVGVEYENRIDALRAMTKTDGCYVPVPVEGEKRGQIRPFESVCQVLEKNLNQFCNRPPMVCRLEISADYQTQLAIPRWKQLDPEANRGLIESFLRAPWADVENMSKASKDKRLEEYKIDIDKALFEGRISFAQAELDLFGLGEANTAYRLDYGNCSVSNADYMKAATAPVTIQYAPEVLRELYKKYLPIGRTTNPGDVFLYEGKAYTVWMGWDESPWKTPREYLQLYVDRTERWRNPANGRVRIARTNVCRFDYQDRKGREK